MDNNEQRNFEAANNSPENKNGKKSNSTKKRLVGVVGGAALAAAVAFGGGAALSQTSNTMAQSNPAQTTPTTTQAAGGSTSTGTGTSTSTNTNPGPGGGMPGRGGRGGGGDPQGGRGGVGGGVSGTISAINGNTLTLTRGTVIVIQATLNSSTVYNKDGTTITLADLKVGQQVSVRTTTATDGTISVSAVDVVLSHANGTVSAIDSGSLTLTKSDNSTVKVTLSASTTYTDLGKAITVADLKTGTRLEVGGTTNSDGSLSAEVVSVQHDRIGGSVTAVNGNTLTIQVAGRDGQGPMPGGPGGRGAPAPSGSSSTTPATPGTGSTTTTAPAVTTKTITVSGSTVYLENGQSVALSEIAVGTNINAEGTLSTDGSSLTALQVMIQLPHYQGQVTSVTGNTIVVQDRDGTSKTITVNSDTKYLNGQTAAALTDVKVGSNIGAEGKVDASGALTATQVQLGQQGPGQGQGGQGGPGGGFGHGPGGH